MMQALQYDNGLKTYHKEKSEKTVIFRSKICDDVDLEVGKMIRLYPPWYVNYEIMNPIFYIHNIQNSINHKYLTGTRIHQ